MVLCTYLLEYTQYMSTSKVWVTFYLPGVALRTKFFLLLSFTPITAVTLIAIISWIRVLKRENCTNLINVLEGSLFKSFWLIFVSFFTIYGSIHSWIDLLIRNLSKTIRCAVFNKDVVWEKLFKNNENVLDFYSEF